MDELISNIEQWGKDKGLDKTDPFKQLAKLVEETGELAEGMVKDRPDQIKDSIGDIVVVLVNLSMELGLSFTDCVGCAWNEIKDRKGKTENGIFLKNADMEHGCVQYDQIEEKVYGG